MTDNIIKLSAYTTEHCAPAEGARHRGAVREGNHSVAVRQRGAHAYLAGLLRSGGEPEHFREYEMEHEKAL